MFPLFRISKLLMEIDYDSLCQVFKKFSCYIISISLEILVGQQLCTFGSGPNLRTGAQK